MGRGQSGGGKSKSSYSQIKEQYNANKLNTEGLKEILLYAIENVPFYSGITEPELSLFPVMTKQAYKREKENCISREFQNTLDSLYTASTSGSTGTPFKVFWDAGKRLRHKAEMIYFNTLIGWELGDHYVFIRNWVSNYSQSKLKSIAQNVTNISIASFDDNKKAWLCNHLKSKKNSILFGYSSSVCDFMNYIKKQNIDGSSLKLKLVVCDSDELTAKNKTELEDTFKCTVINRYDNEENGLLATSLPGENKFTVNFPSIYMELLKPDSDEPAEKGEIGRIVVTDLFNHAMPLIRYDVGDYAISDDEPGDIKTLRVLSGRKADSLYAIDGKLISSVAISGITEIFTEIEKYQIVQKSKTDFDFNYIGKLSKNNNELLSQRLHDSLGATANIDLIEVNNLEARENGKFKTTVNMLTYIR